MKKLLQLLSLALFTAFSFTHTVSAQCVDSTLIDPNAICTMEWAPVCGCNGITYSNDCVATYSGGVTSWVNGECASQSDCNILPTGVDFGLCEMALGWIMTTDNVCVSMSGCGTVGSDGLVYSSYFYESEFQCNSQCLGDTVVLTCIDTSLIILDAPCPDQYIPVCGCDGITYFNACEAVNHNGVVYYTEGPCASNNTQCFDVSNVDFGDCDLALGFAFNGSTCVAYSGCGYGANGIDYSPFFYNNIDDCTTNCDGYVQPCINPNQISDFVFCTADWVPVCGCDNVTYSNACMAFYFAGVTTWTDGECPNSVGIIRRDTYSFYPNPAENTLTLEFLNQGEKFFRLLDMQGKAVLHETIVGIDRKTIDISSLPTGIYIIEVSNEWSIRQMDKLIKI